MSNWRERVASSKNQKVLAMLSGGKDSIASVIQVKEAGLAVEAVHFVHQWGSEIPTGEAGRICGEYGIPLHVIDFTEEFCEAIEGYTAGRPCLLCKKQMYRKLLAGISETQYGWLCIGDNGDDRTTIARIREYIECGHLDETLECSSYFGSEMGIRLHEDMNVLRPLIRMTAGEVEDYLACKGVKINRIGSTGDKYFEYHREGCPVQFADAGVPLSKPLFGELKKYNDAITEYARQNHILASIHLPSTFIITIPRGHEKEAADYLRDRGLPVEEEANSADREFESVRMAYAENLAPGMFDTEAYIKTAARMCERLEVKQYALKTEKAGRQVLIWAENPEAGLCFWFDFDRRTVSVRFEYNETSNVRKEKGIFENLIVELFRTRKYVVL